MDPYVPTSWVNNTAPAINATNLAKIENALQALNALLSGVTITGSEYRIGSVSNYLAIEVDGTIERNGAATVFRDEVADLLKTGTNNPSAHLIQNFTDGTLDYKTNSDLNDYALSNYQINHDWKPGSEVEPHIHWFSRVGSTPNWLIQYRWQRNGQAKTSAWTYKRWASNAFAHPGGTTIINQITSFGNITPPSSYYPISDVLQVRFMRDVSDGSSMFSGASDVYSGNAEAFAIDVHIECDTDGSRGQYSK
jgi:hypothetical protein